LNKDIKWLFSLKEQVLEFLDHQKSQNRAGYYQYSYSGDIYNDESKWNIGSSVYALKIYYTLGVKKNQDIINTIDYIKSFTHSNGEIYDDFIFKKSFIRNFASSVKNGYWDNLTNKRYIRAETRQAYSSLMLYDEVPEKVSFDFPRTKNDIADYLSSMDWSEPWGAGSHFSHLMFFYRLSMLTKTLDTKEYEELVSYSIDWVNKLRNIKDGGWYKGKQSDRIVVNGAMKIITGLIAVDKSDFEYGKELVDTCLRSTNDEHACDNFNIIFVLNYASKLLNREYRQSEIEQFALNRLQKYKAHYKSRQGGFSFYPNYSNKRYYSAKITKGLNEADIHGTVLFLWGVSIVAQILGIEKELGFREFMT
jgi:hypothetical protein